MKTIRFLLPGLAACCLTILGWAQKPASGISPSRGSATSQEIAAQYAELEQSVELQFAKLIRETRNQIGEVIRQIKELDQRQNDLKASAAKLAGAARKTPRAGQQSVGPATEQEIKAQLAAIDLEIKNIMIAIAKAKDQIKALEAQIAKLERDKARAIEDLRKQKAKALQDVAKAEEERRARSR